MRVASKGPVGFPRINPLIVTIVSAPKTKLPRMAGRHLNALARASRRA